MRTFMSAWTKAQENAQNNARVTLWNLDASAMQEIHFSASTDSDPYDGHLSEFLAKEYLWDVERSKEVKSAILKLDTCFKERLRESAVPPVISMRFMAPFVNSAVSRSLVSHFTWSGFDLNSDILAKSDEKIMAVFSQTMPFGTVLSPHVVAEGSEFLVHITQQCDILSVVRPTEKGFTAKFAIAQAIEVSDSRVPQHQNNEVVARGLGVGGKEYDLKLLEGNILALPVSMLLSYLRSNSYSIFGRLRHEFATHFLVATANHMTRPASIKTTRAQVHKVNIYLYGELFSNGPLLSCVGDEGLQCELWITKKEKPFYFSDESSMRIALWIKGYVDLAYTKGLDVQKACDSFSVGISNDGNISGIVSLQFEGALSEQGRKNKFPTGDAKIKDRVRLVAICTE